MLKSGIIIFLRAIFEIKLREKIFRAIFLETEEKRLLFRTIFPEKMRKKIFLSGSSNQKLSK